MSTSAAMQFHIFASSGLTNNYHVMPSDAFAPRFEAIDLILQAITLATDITSQLVGPCTSAHRFSC